MAKDKNSIKKEVGVKKINAYSKENCTKEIERLKAGKQANSRYYWDVVDRLEVLKKA